MLIIIFRSKLTAQAGEDYQAMNAEMESLVRQNPGFIDVEESLREWRNLMRHREAQKTGRAKWYEYYEMEVASVVRTSSFARATQ